jgi:hypothetical protein
LGLRTGVSNRIDRQSVGFFRGFRVPGGHGCESAAVRSEPGRSVHDRLSTCHRVDQEIVDVERRYHFDYVGMEGGLEPVVRIGGACIALRDDVITQDDGLPIGEADVQVEGIATYYSSGGAEVRGLVAGRTLCRVLYRAADTGQQVRCPRWCDSTLWVAGAENGCWDKERLAR